MTNESMSRRGFLAGTGALAATVGLAAEKKAAPVPADPFLGTQGVPLKVGCPNLQAPGETTMGVTWKVSGLSKGVVEYADNPAFENSVFARPGGYGLVPIDVAALQVRLEGLKPATRYWYRTITTPFTDYRNIYNAKLGAPVVSKAYSFTTLGAGARAHFCMMSDTHATWKPFGMVVKKIRELAPAAVVWNGDATNTTQKKETAVEIFLDPPVAGRDYSASIPVLFASGNHDFRGSWISRLEEVVQPRHPAERRGDQWDLKWNFAVRLGEMALIGMDTGEDKPDSSPAWYGLANFEPYRRAQAAWLAEQVVRPEIAAAKFKILFCHIPIFAAEGHPDYPYDDGAYWSRECHDLWAPILKRAGVQLVVCGHMHRFRFDAPTADRPWAQVIGGGPELGTWVVGWKDGRVQTRPDAGAFPTVVEGKVENGRLRLVVHDVFNGRVVLDREIA